MMVEDLDSARLDAPAGLELAAEPSSGSWTWPWVVGVLALALALRIAWGAVVPVGPKSDCYAYDHLARSIAAGQGFGFQPDRPTAFWAVGTSAVVAALYKVFGVGYGPVVVMNILVGVATVWLTMLLTRHWIGARAGLAAGLLMAVWPGQIQYSTIVGSELLFNLGVVVALWFESRDRWRPGVRAVLTGAALAAASYVRPLALLLPVVMVWCRFVGPEAGRRRPMAVLAEAATAVAVMLALIAPWTMRNNRVFGHPVLISTNSGSNLWVGNNPDSNGAYMPLPDDVKPMNEAERDALLGSRAKQYIRENPGAFVVGFFKKLVLLHDRENIGVVWNRDGLTRVFGPGSLMPLKVVSSAYWWGVMLLAILGAGIALARLGFVNWLGLPPLALWAYYAGVHAVIVGGDRYHYPSAPMIAALAGLGVVVMLDRFRGRRLDGQTPAPDPAA